VVLTTGVLLLHHQVQAVPTIEVLPDQVQAVLQVPVQVQAAEAVQAVAVAAVAEDNLAFNL
jgi:hypothetical protein